jgi:hypothetical protein
MLMLDALGYFIPPRTALGNAHYICVLVVIVAQICCWRKGPQGSPVVRTLTLFLPRSQSGWNAFFLQEEEPS